MTRPEVSTLDFWNLSRKCALMMILDIKEIVSGLQHNCRSRMVNGLVFIFHSDHSVDFSDFIKKNCFSLSVRLDNAQDMFTMPTINSSTSNAVEMYS